MQPPAALSTLEYAQVPCEIWLPMWLDDIGPSNADLSPAVHQFTDQRIREASSSLRGVVVATDQLVGCVTNEPAIAVYRTLARQAEVLVFRKQL